MTKLSTSARQDIFRKLANGITQKLHNISFPSRVTPAGTKVFRFVGRVSDLDYFDLFSQHPKGSEQDHRWSGPRWNGQPGVSGSYWGSTHGIAAETFFYSCVKDYNPSTGPRRLLPSLTPLLVHGANSRMPYHAEQGAPGILPHILSYNTDILIARTNHDLDVVDMDLTSSGFQEWNQRITRAIRAELDSLEFTDFAAAMSHSQFKGLARLVGNVASINGNDAIVAKSARADDYKAPSYDPTQANNLVLLGQDRESFTDKLTGTAVIQIRPDTIAGVKATLKPFTVYSNKQERGLVPAGSSEIFMSASSEAESGPKSDT